MYVQRCPECGQRLKSNYCDICMRKVPFGGVKLANRRDPWDSHDGSSAHRQEKGHECVSFDMEKKPQSTFRSYRKSNAANKKGASVVAIVLAILSLLPALFGIFEETVESVPAPEPQCNVYDGFVEAGDLGAEDVPNVIAGEIYNANGVRITADTAGLSYGEYSIFLTVYNDTDQNLSISIDMMAVNDYMLNCGLYQDVKAGKSEQTYVTLYSHELEKMPIVKVSDVKCYLNIYDEGSFDPIVHGELVTIATDYDGSAEPVVDISGLELYHDGSLCVLLSGVSLLDSGECQLDLYMENLSGSSVNVYSGAVAVNGQEVSGYIGKTLLPDTRAIDRGYIYELDERVDLAIEELYQIDEITIDLYIDYMDGWDVTESYSEAITFDPNMIY